MELKNFSAAKCITIAVFGICILGLSSPHPLWAASGTITNYNNCYVPIPDGPNANHVSAAVTTSGAPSGSIITKVKVYYEVRHTWREDLKIWLTAYYNGRWNDFILRDREGGSTHDWVETRDNLSAWNGASPNQTWYLCVQDRAAGDVGYIDFVQVWVDWTDIGNINVDVRDSTGSRLPSNEMNAVILFDSGGTERGRIISPSSNPMTFTNRSFGNYFVDVYCWDMLTERQNFSHNSLTTTIYPQTYPKRPLKTTVYYTGGTVLYAGASVYLDSWNGQTQIWTQRASGTTGPDGTFTFSAWPTTISGERYRIRVKNSNGTEVFSNFPYTLANSSGGSSYDISTSQQPPQFITLFTTPTGTKQRGQEAQTTVRVKNASTVARNFWVGMSYAHENATHDNWPTYHYDIKPQQTSVLQPDQEETLTFACELHPNLWPGQYYARSRIWNDYNPETHRMVGEPIDDTLFYSQWKDPTDPVNGTGMPSFSLGAYTLAPDTFLGQVQYAVLKDFWQVPTLENLYYNGEFSEKPLLYISAGDRIWQCFGLPLDAGGSVLIDLADLFGLTPESKEGEDWVTIWVDVGAALGIGTDIGFDMGVMPHGFSYSERATADYRRYLTGEFGTLSTPLFTFTIAEWQVGSPPEFFRLNWAGRTSLGVDLIGASYNLTSIEVNRRLLIAAMQAATPGPMGLRGLCDSILQGFQDMPIRSTTYDDGCWILYDGVWESPLKLQPPNATDFFAHYFAFDVPVGASRVRFVSDNVGQNRIGNADLYVQYGARPTLSSYRLRSMNSGNYESLYIDNPDLGRWHVMLPASTAYDQVQFAAILEAAGPPVVTITAIDPYASEPGFDTGIIRLSRTGATSGSLTVSINKSGTAIHGVDYQALLNSVTLAAGQATVDFVVVPIDDTLVEGDETVIITVMPGSGYEVDSPSSATVVIADNDVADIQRPTAVANVSGISTGGGGTHSFTVTYSDNVAVDVATIDSSDIRVTGPNGFDQIAAFVSLNQAGNGTPRTATYRINAPGGTWDYADNGTYSVAMRPNQVADTSGNSVLEGLLATFTVNIPGTGPTIDPIPDATTPSPAGTPYTGPVPTVTGTPPFTWSLITGPSGMTIDPATGVVSWPNPTPPSSSHLVTIRVTNAQGFDEESWYVSVPAITGNIYLILDPSFGTSGNNISITVGISDNNQGIGAFGLELIYDSSLLVFQGVEKGSLTSDWSLVEKNEIEPGKIKIDGYAGGGTIISPYSNGSLVGLKMQVRCLGYDEETKIQLKIENYADGISSFLPRPCTADFTFMPCPRLGDVNGDGEITPADALEAFEIYLAKLTASFCQETTSDANCDGSTTPGDAQDIFDHYLEKRILPECCSETTGYVSPSSLIVSRDEKRLKPSERKLYALDTICRSDEIVNIPIIITNPEGISSFSFEVNYFPELLEFIGLKRSPLTHEFDYVRGIKEVEGLVRIEGESQAPIKSNKYGSLAVMVFKVKKGINYRLPITIFNQDKNLFRVEVDEATFTGVDYFKDETRFLSFGEAIIAPDRTLRIPMEVSSAFNMKSFGLELKYLTEKMLFIGVNRGALTEDFMAFEGNELEEGIVRVGGYSLSGVQEEGPGVLFELVFYIREKGGEVEIVKLVDDIKNYVINKRNIEINK